MNYNSRIFVAGHNGLVGSALLRFLKAAGYINVITRTRFELNLADVHAVLSFFKEERPEFVFMAAARVGGILENNTYPGEFLYENLTIELAIIEASRQTQVTRLVLLGSSCIYPKMCQQPIRESYYLTGLLEETNRAYANAKIAGIELCYAYNRQYGTKFAAVMPSNVYGLNDNWDLASSHVLPALLVKAHLAKNSGAKEMIVWGTGKPRREFLHSDDLAEACVVLMNSDSVVFDKLCDGSEAPIVNIGTGIDISIEDLARLVANIVDFSGTIMFDPSKPDGTPQKLLDIAKMQQMGWSPKIPLEVGVRDLYDAVRDTLEYKIRNRIADSK
jgi:GDP-L-fucose synthase